MLVLGDESFIVPADGLVKSCIAQLYIKIYIFVSTDLFQECNDYFSL